MRGSQSEEIDIGHSLTTYVIRRQRGNKTTQDPHHLPIADRASLAKIGIKIHAPVRVGKFNSVQKHFLDYHREEILLAAAM